MIVSGRNADMHWVVACKLLATGTRPHSILRSAMGIASFKISNVRTMEVDDIDQLLRCVTIERASLQKASTTGRMLLLPTEIDLHHNRFLAEVIAPFDDLPAKFAVEPFG